MKQKLVIVGNGMAAGRLLDEMIKRDISAFDVTVIGDEPEGSYNRIMLSPVLAGQTAVDDIIGKPAHWYGANNIHFLPGVRVTRIERGEKTVLTDQHQNIPYDHLILAVGSRPARIPAENQELASVFSFRTLADVDRILASSAAALSNAQATDTDALVIGAGLLGLEAAYGLAVKGLRVTVVHRSHWLLNRQLDEQAGQLLQKVLASHNIEFRLGDEVTRFDGDDTVTGAQFKNSNAITCKLVVIATGITPNAELGLEADLAGKRGVEVDALMATSDPHISAVGECTEFEGATFGLVDPIWQHCVTLASRLCQNQNRPYVNTPTPTKLKVSGVNLFSAGEFMTQDHHRELVYADLDAGIYRKILLQDDVIVGVVLFGDTRDGQDYFTLLSERQNVADIVPLLLMGRAFYASDNKESEAA
ncbi:FAD-dependent oxidoreductase [Gilvimarinus sp. SDUM040013]|uniref:FAD-dependent oxidoreductase n=1 Tax=Gilvimarinus gilvus TaxID=3058038 RepID=A0ABU4RVL9_9GAMM|nr:FAD-dependent oxidoreductase [Gilvimarinus sp. SDUM040013]MDO3388168.1 FAD-dependent oxidoreductase [Gilvimarinus sp. SDUM040013]MDX6847718.1 FAD-dependent oxidoreductase [Gilvimarinus sp. SDUM040013]